MDLQTIVGVALIFVGMLMIVVAVLVSIGWIKPGAPRPASAGESGFWNLIMELLKKAPWYAVVGLLLIYFGLRMLGVQLF